MERLNSGLDPSAITSLPHATLGRPLLLTSKLDDEIAEYIRALRLAGGIVNRSIVVASAKGYHSTQESGIAERTWWLTRHWSEMGGIISEKA